MNRDILGSQRWLKRLLFIAVGMVSYPVFRIWNPLRIQGIEVLHRLPQTGVLFVSSHQTYFADVIAMILIFSSLRAKSNKSHLPFPWYLPLIRTSYYYVAAEETMMSGFMPKMLAYGGSINTRRTFREAGQEVKKMARLGDFTKVFEALDDGWVMTFPQGTTTPYAKGRRGVCHIIKMKRPVVVPVVIGGFRAALGKRGFSFNNPGRKTSITFKEPLVFADDMNANVMLRQIMEAIEQIPPPGYVAPVEQSEGSSHGDESE